MNEVVGRPTAGGLFAALTVRLPVLELRDNRRQQPEWEIEALRQLRDGNTTHALHAYVRHDRITVGYDVHHTKMLLLGDWWASTVRGDDAVMLAGRRADVAEPYICGHVRAEAAGHLDGPMLEVGSVPMRAGDRVMMLRNDTRIGIRNGNRGVILDVDPDERTMRVRLPRGEVDLPTRYLDAGNVGLAYAITVNKAHGMTSLRISPRSPPNQPVDPQRQQPRVLSASAPTGTTSDTTKIQPATMSAKSRRATVTPPRHV